MDETDESNVLVRVARSLGLEEKLTAARDALEFDLALQAEVIGPGIQKNKYGLSSVTLRVFNVLNLDAYRPPSRPLRLRCRSARTSCGSNRCPSSGRWS